jgi:hypothetical protein
MRSEIHLRTFQGDAEWFSCSGGVCQLRPWITSSLKSLPCSYVLCFSEYLNSSPQNCMHSLSSTRSANSGSPLPSGPSIRIRQLLQHNLDESKTAALSLFQAYWSIASLHSFHYNWHETPVERNAGVSSSFSLHKTPNPWSLSQPSPKSPHHRPLLCSHHSSRARDTNVRVPSTWRSSFYTISYEPVSFHAPKGSCSACVHLHANEGFFHCALCYSLLISLKCKYPSVSRMLPCMRADLQLHYARRSSGGHI